jgi:addiction module HigA family antidote
MKSDHALIPALVVPPGQSIQEELDARGWTRRQLAEKMGRPVQMVNQIITGRRRITAETALALADALGTSAEMWLGLECRYRLHLARQARRRPA